VFAITKRLLVGRPLRSGRLGETLLSKRLALPVFCSDPLSSNAYATEEILRALSLGGLALIFLTPWVGLAVVVLLAVVVVSYRQTCYAYPNGGGAYAVSRENLGRNAALVAASALLVDYVLTVAVSVAAGVDAITSAFLSLRPHAVGLSLLFVAVLALMNLRGVKESGTVFAIPTYGFIAVIFGMIGWGFWRLLTGNAPVAESASFAIAPSHSVAGVAVALIALRAFAQGCTALTGVEAVSNGVPNFKPPKSRNAANTLAAMGAVTIAMFAGITALALIAHVRLTDDPSRLIGAPAGYEQRTAIAQVAGAVFGYHSVFFFLVQAFTAAILVLAANTAFNGFPILASILGRDGYLPRQFGRRGDRLVFSNGIIILAALAGLLIWGFSASTSRLIQLYIIGVFVSFTLSQAGMVRHWTARLRGAAPGARSRLRRARLINAGGALLTGLVLVVVLSTKFTHGAYLVVIAMPALFALMKAVERHYHHVGEELAPGPGGISMPSRIQAVVLVSRLDLPTLQALAYAKATRPDTLTALTVATGEAESQQLERE
jgi:amino acid transporter